MSKKRVLVVGSGGREHAICWKLAQSPLLEELYVAPGNGGTDAVAVSVPAKTNDEIVSFAKDKNIDVVVVGPEAPLAAGLADLLIAEGVAVFGPKKAAAQLESSKIFSKRILTESEVRTADWESFDDFDSACNALSQWEYPMVIKADGLAAGKGVVIAQSEGEARQALEEMMCNQKFGDSGKQVLFEKFLVGEEASVMAMCSGSTVLVYSLSQDYKRLGTGDEGPNTGGMGTISPARSLDDQMAAQIVEEVYQPVLKKLAEKGIDYCGFLYAGLMVAPSGELSVVEFNVRLGDPETQVLLPRLESDLLELILAFVDDESDRKSVLSRVKWSDKHACCVVCASEGYPESPVVGREITKLPADSDDIMVFHAGTTKKEGKLFTSGGRVLNVVGVGQSIEDARTKAYRAVDEVEFEGMYNRTDIGE